MATDTLKIAQKYAKRNGYDVTVKVPVYNGLDVYELEDSTQNRIGKAGLPFYVEVDNIGEVRELSGNETLQILALINS